MAGRHAADAYARSECGEQIAQIAASIAEFGFTNPILIGTDGVIIAGHGRLLAAQRLGMADVPTIVLDHLTDAQRRALVIAEAANPEWVSVPLVGWSLARALGEVADVHLVTQVRNREAILRAGLVEGRDFTAIDSEVVARPLWYAGEVLRMGKGRGWTTAAAVNAMAYAYFERLVWRRFGPALRAGAYDLVHRITPLTPTIGSTLASRCAERGVPFVLGPLNGGVPWPRGFDAERWREREWLSYVRNVYKALPERSRTLGASAAIMVGSRHTEGEIPPAHRDRCIYLPENAIDADRFGASAPRDAVRPLRACFVGRMVPYKGPDMLLEAAAPLLADGRMTLDLVGDGPMMGDLQRMARDLPPEAVRFHGWLAHDAVPAVMGRAHLLTFPSIREFGGGVVLEAMALGVVPVVVDYAGPGELVVEGTGYKVPIGDRAAIVAGLRATLAGIAADPAPLPAIAERARERARTLFTWQAKARQVAEVYAWATGRRADRPVFFAADGQVAQGA